MRNSRPNINKEVSLMSVARSVWTALVAVVTAVGMLAGAGSALAESKSFTTKGCETWEVPAGVSSVGISAVGAAGGAGNPSGGAGGAGDEVSASLAVIGGQMLDVCVDVGGATGGKNSPFTAGEGATGEGGNGGGASGVSVGSSFALPVLVSAGGGGGGEGACFGEVGNCKEPYVSGGGGGSAGVKGGSGEPVKGSTAAAGGAVEGGAKSNAAGPGAGAVGAEGEGPETEQTHGGAGGGGGGGYVGGGGGASGGTAPGSALRGSGGGGGAGGTDFCGGTGVTCGATNAGVGTGTGTVAITYTLLPTSKEQCKKGGWKNFGTAFKNQGQCVKFVEAEIHPSRSHRHHHSGALAPQGAQKAPLYGPFPPGGNLDCTIGGTPTPNTFGFAVFNTPGNETTVSGEVALKHAVPRATYEVLFVQGPVCEVSFSAEFTTNNKGNGNLHFTTPRNPAATTFLVEVGRVVGGVGMEFFLSPAVGLD
jgi:hypothetical protein